MGDYLGQRVGGDVCGSTGELAPRVMRHDGEQLPVPSCKNENVTEHVRHSKLSRQTVGAPEENDQAHTDACPIIRSHDLSSTPERVTLRLH